MEKNNYTLLEKIIFPKTTFNLEKLKEKLTDKTVLITGASFGIGEELAYKLSHTNAHLILVGRTTEKLINIQNKIVENGGIASIFTADLRKQNELQELIFYLNSLEKGVDYFISNAGKSIRRSFFESIDRFHDVTRTMDINFNAPVQLIIALTPILLKNKGHIINISAINVLLPPFPKWAAYQASKTAFDQWFRCISPELNANFITTTSIYLPLVKTRMISPTKSYDKVPAMKPDHVASIICKSILQEKKRYKPWWLFIGEFGVFIFRTPIELSIKKRTNKELNSKNQNHFTN